MGTNNEQDPGIAAVTELFRRVQIDEEWSVHEPRGFTWWPHLLAQRVWATPAADRLGVQMCQVHIETDLLRDVSSLDLALRLLSTLNLVATMSSCFLDQGRVRLHASVHVSRMNLTAATTLAMHAMNLQLADSYRYLRFLLDQMGGTPDYSVHPQTGARATPDDMLNVGRLYTNGDPAIGGRLRFEQLSVHPQRCWLTSVGGVGDFSAEMGMTRDAASGFFREGPLCTALYQAQIKGDHPQWGIGVDTRLLLPFDDEGRYDLANHFNVMESRSPDSHQLGGWCLLGNGLTFKSFFPIWVFSGEPADYAANLFAGLVWHQWARAPWANTVHAPV
jgi:hypothetical protein